MSPARTTTTTTTATATAATTVTGTATASATAAPTGSTASAPSPTQPSPPTKTYDCGAKGQKPCPMQGWMKRVMAPASASDDAPALAKALTYVAGHVPPGFDEWSSIASGAATKAKAGDTEGAKASCKPCHDLYKDKYKASMRDRPF